jgi:two-component system cell cycle response regulator DivK
MRGYPMPNTILVVDDYEDTRRLYVMMLEDLGFRVLEADDGYHAVAMVRKEHPNLVLMDMSMPGMDGIGATKLIKEMIDMTDVTIIGITANGNLYNEKAIEAGCDAIISKPIEIKTLSSMISLYVQP